MITVLYQFTIRQINFGTLILLFCLMGVVAEIQRLGYIDLCTLYLMNRAQNIRRIAYYLIGSSFFFSMFLTNDVALIILVPFTIGIINRIGASDQLIRFIVLETIAANMGSMLTPIGNPQNVFLYQNYKMTLVAFYRIILPYGVVAFVLLGIFIFILFPTEPIEQEQNITDTGEAYVIKHKLLWTIVFIVLFLLCILTVLRFVPHVVTFFAVFIGVFLCDRKIFCRINYGLLIKFIILFIVVGDVAQIPWINKILSTMIVGNEVAGGILISQIVSNVPAAILIARFTSNGNALLLGVNIGGLGTLIASMASMISLDYYEKSIFADKKAYILSFTKYNILFLLIEIVLVLLLL